jgi:hypothetical protein
MKTIISLGIIGIGALLLAACSGADAPAGGEDPNGGARQTLKATGDCSFQTCGAVPSSMESEVTVVCREDAGDSCAWSPSAADSTSSYRECGAEECPAPPAIECPETTVQASQRCGSENDAACAWTTACVPPRITTPCADAHGCDEQPVQTIGIICKDGSAGGFACVTDGRSCFLERNCD